MSRRLVIPQRRIVQARRRAPNVHRILVPGGARGRLREAFYRDAAFDLHQLPGGCRVHSAHNGIPFVGAEWLAYQCADADSVSTATIFKYGDSTTGFATSQTDLQSDFGDTYTATPIITPSTLSMRHILEGTEHLPQDVKEVGLFSTGSGFTIDSYAGDDVMIARVVSIAFYSPTPTSDDDTLWIWDFSLSVNAGMMGTTGSAWLWKRMTDPAGNDVPAWYVWGTGSEELVTNAVVGEETRTKHDLTPDVNTSSPDWAEVDYRSDYAGGEEIFQTGIALSGDPREPVLFADLATGFGAGETGPISNRDTTLRFESG